MSLSTQLARGPLALALLVALVALALFAEPPRADASPLPSVAYAAVDQASACVRIPPPLRLAQAPADLRLRSTPWLRGCRA